MSEIKVNKISPRTACGTTTLGDSGDTINIPAGVTISNSGTATGFGATGAVNWDVASIKTADFTGVAGVGYFVDTATSGAVIVTLPASPTAGDVIGVADYANNFDAANCTLNRNGSNIGGLAINGTLSDKGLAITLVFVDATKGWIITDSGNQSEGGTAQFVAATGGTVTFSGDLKIHTFTSPGTFAVSALGNSGGSTTVDYLVVAGGGGGGAGCAAGGGGGGGGMRFSFPNPGSGGHPVSVQSYPITVGGGGTAGAGPATGPGSDPAADGSQGSSSIFDSITSAGGGLGGAGAGNNRAGGAGGSGGGGGRYALSGAGNTPAAPTPLGGPQGNPGGTGGGSGTPSPAPGGGGGGGRTAAGGNACGSAGGVGGNGTSLTISGSCTAYAGGGGGGSYPAPTAQKSGGVGGGGKGAPPAPPLSDMDGTVNTGGGGGGGSETPSYGTPTNDSPGGAGGSGIVIISYKYQ